MTTNIELWNRYGDHLIPVMPFMDNVIARQEGSYFIDVEGNRLLDLASGQFCTILGHNHPEFIKSLQQELGKTLHTGSQFVTEPVLKAAAKVAEITPANLNNVIFLSTGSEANEFAIRVAKLCKNRQGIIGFDRGYYGITLGTRSLSTISRGHVDFSPRVPETYHILAPNPRDSKSELEQLEYSLRLIEDQLDNIAAIIIEPIISAGGMIYPSKNYIQALRKLATDIDAFLIVDEAQTGFGRCGAWFDVENLEVEPDILVFSKTSGNGYPSSGVVINDKTKERLLDKGFHHLSSHQNDPLTATAVSSVIDIIRNENLLEACSKNGAYFLSELKRLENEYENLHGARGRGLMLAFELVKDKQTLEPYFEMTTPFVLACKQLGVHITYSYYESAMRVIPAITLSKDEIDFAINVFEKVLKKLQNGQLKEGENQPQNPVFQSMIKRNRIKQKLLRMWETSPSYWIRKLKAK